MSATTARRNAVRAQPLPGVSLATLTLPDYGRVARDPGGIFQTGLAKTSPLASQSARLFTDYVRYINIKWLYV